MQVRELRHRVRGVSIRLLRGGSGTPLLFLHGAGGLPIWNLFFDKLAERYDVLVPEHPGFGTSDHPDWIRNVADVAMYYLDFLDELAGQRVHLVGNSLGGWIAAELAVRNSAPLASLTLLAPAGVRVKGVLCGDNFIWSAEEATRNLFYDQTIADRLLAMPLSEEQQDLLLTNRFMAAKLGWEPRWFDPALERWLHRIKVPTLVLWGAEDRLLPAAYAKVWGERVPDVRVEIIPECGHLPHVEKAAVAAEKILDFLAGRPS
jgi:pimeloyl-ACP methyl ester carboxylesterase